MKQTLSVFVVLALSLPALAVTSAKSTKSPAPLKKKSALEAARGRRVRSTVKTGDFIDATQESASQTAAAKANPNRAPIGTVSPSETRALGPLKADAKPELKTAVKTPQAAPAFKFAAALKNTLTLARKEQLELIGGEAYQLDNEVVLGARHRTGWGLGFTATHRTRAKADIDNVNIRRDASLVFEHPSLYKSAQFSIDGKFRVYLPTSEWSQDNNFRQFRYYNMMNLKLPQNLSLFNLVLPMFFSQRNPTDTDAHALTLIATELSHQTTPWMSLSLGQQTQIENHYGTPTATTVEIYPYADFTFIPNVTIEPKFYIPVFVSGTIGGAPSEVSIEQSQFELQVTIAI